IADEEGGAPTPPQRYGWKAEEFAAGATSGFRYKPQGPCVGWLAGGELYLEPEASFAVAQSLARDQGDALAVTPVTLRRRVTEQGLRGATDEGRGKLTGRRTLQGARREVLHVARRAAPSPE